MKFCYHSDVLCVRRFQNAKRNIVLCEIPKALSNALLSLPPSAKKTSGDMDCKCSLFCKQQSKYICATDFFQIVNGILTKCVHFDVFLTTLESAEPWLTKQKPPQNWDGRWLRWLAGHHITCRAPVTVSTRTMKENILRVSLTALYVALFKHNSIQHCCQTLDNIWSHKHIHMFFQMTFGILKEKKK